MALLHILVTLLMYTQTIGGQSTGNTDGCGAQTHFTENNGEIVSHTGYGQGQNYTGNTHCVWTIEAPEGSNVELVALTFSIEGHETCSFDFLELFEGDSTNSPSIGRFCGAMFKPITSEQRFLTLLFETDRTGQGTGFRLFYNFTTEIIRACPENYWTCSNHKCIFAAYRCDQTDDCGDGSDELNCKECTESEFSCSDGGRCIPPAWQCDGDIDCNDGSDEDSCSANTNTYSCGGNKYMNGTSGSITSPNYPGNYPADVHCVHVIDAPYETKNIEFRFGGDFHVEEHYVCSYDSVMLRGHDTDGHAQIQGPYCGDVSPGAVNITGNYATVTFRSDTSNQFAGFTVDWQAYR